MKLRDSLVIFLLITVFFSFTSCNKVAQNYISRHERIEENDVKTYYTLPLIEKVGMYKEDLFFNESSILENSVFLLGKDFGQIKLYNFSSSPIPLLDSEKNTYAKEFKKNQIFPSKLPDIFSSLLKDTRNISLTSSNSELFLLQNQYESTSPDPEMANSFVFKNQIVSKITPSNSALTNISIESDKLFNQIRYYKTKENEFLLTSSNSNPFALEYCIISDKKITFSDFFNSKKEIFAWDFKENQLVILFSDLTVEHFLIDITSEIPTIKKQTVLDSIDESIKRPVIHINPKKSSFLLWEAIPKGKTWIIVDGEEVDSYWCNIHTSTNSVLVNEISTLNEINNENVFVGANTVSKIDPRISLCSFFVLGNTQDNHSNQWLSIGTRTIDGDLFNKQFPRSK